MSNPIRLADLFRYYKALPHQSAAIAELEQAINAAAPGLLTREQHWFKTWSVSGKQTEYPNTWEGITRAAKDAGAKYPELVGAQWALESGYGKHVSGRNNFFGIKGSGTSTQTQEFINGNWVTITAGFIDFPDLFSCVDYLVSRWYRDYEKYKGCNNAPNRNEAAKWLVHEGYATDPNYAGKLIQLMEQHATATKIHAELPTKTGFNPASPFDYKITPHITYGELCLNEDRRRFKNQSQCAIALELCTFLEKVRARFGNRPIVVTSGHRPEPINSSVGGASNSEHLYKPGCGAVDFYIDGADTKAVQDYCDREWPYSVGYGAYKGFVHLGIRDGRARIRWDY
jgi:uncharacterized protein YcbK (DUF882 family)